MAFQQQLEPEITQGLMARYVARTPAADVADGGVAHALFKTAGEEFALVQQAINGRLNTRLLDVAGTDLDQAVDLFTAGQVPRLGPASASGPCLRVKRSNTTGDLVVPAGTTYGRSDNSAVYYIQTADITIPAGSNEYGSAGAYVPVTCATPGTIGNCIAGTIDVIQGGAPATLIEVAQDAAIGGGLDYEQDNNYRSRARDYAAAQADRTTRQALLFIAKTYQSTDGTRARHASIYESPSQPGYVELVVDDGTGFAGQTRPGTTSTVTVANNQPRIVLEAPIVDDNLSTTQVTIDTFNPSTVGWLLVSETGELWFNSGVVTAGQVVSAFDYTVYTGFVAELQQVLAGTRIGPFGTLSCIAAGCRVRVVPPTVELLTFNLHIEPVPGAVLATLKAQCQAVLTEYCASLAPGQSWLLMDAYATLRANIPSLLNATFQSTTSGGLPAVAADFPPSSERNSLRLDPDAFEVT